MISRSDNREPSATPEPVAPERVLLDAVQALLARERTATERTERLAAVTAALAEALTASDVITAAVEHGRAALEADEGALWLVDPSGTTAELAHAVGASPPRDRAGTRLLLEGGQRTPVGDTLRTGEPVWIESRSAWARRYPELEVAGSAAGSELALASLPLKVEARSIGVAAFTFRRARPFDEEERVFLLVLSSHCAQTLERARLYEAERAARAEAEAALRAREEVLAIVSHDLKNPLNAVLMSALLLERGARDPERVSHHVAVIRRASARMDRLIRDLLDLSSMEAGKFRVERQPQGAVPLVVEAVALMHPVAALKPLTLEAEGPADDVAVLCDRERVLQVFSNLIGNAVAFTPAGGRVTVRAEGSGEWVRFAVADTGPGIPEPEQPYVFDRYWKSRESRHGSGLGLSIAKGIVEAHGGRIWFESRPGRGATFYFTLPRAARLAPEATSAAI